MRRCQRIGCENSLDHLRADAEFCGPTCKREAARARALSRENSASGDFWSRYMRLRRRRRRRTPVAAVLVTLAAVMLTLAGCGGSAHRHASTVTVTSSTSIAPNVAARCPSSGSFMGCASGAAARPSPPKFGARLLTIAGTKFPDVSQWQGCSINWPGVNTRGLVAKAWENAPDPCYPHNAASARAGGKIVIPYDFVRSCSAAGFIAEVNRVQGRPPAAVIDEEVPAAANCTGTLTAQIKRAWPGITVDEYTSPGTEQPGASVGDDPLWIADYGPGFPCLWTCHPVAWQFAAPPFAFVKIAGLGQFTDVSVDYGLLEQGAPPAPSDAQHYAWYDQRPRTLDHQRMVEAKTVRTWDGAHCSRPARRRVCVTSTAHMKLLLSRDQAVYRRQSAVARNANHTGGRIQGLVHRLTGTGRVTHWL